jgi:hypothetical protein
MPHLFWLLDEITDTTTNRIRKAIQTPQIKSILSLTGSPDTQASNHGRKNIAGLRAGATGSQRIFARKPTQPSKSSITVPTKIITTSKLTM